MLRWPIPAGPDFAAFGGDDEQPAATTSAASAAISGERMSSQGFTTLSTVVAMASWPRSLGWNVSDGPRNVGRLAGPRLAGSVNSACSETNGPGQAAWISVSYTSGPWPHGVRS